jgi:hypothetical protein
MANLFTRISAYTFFIVLISAACVLAPPALHSWGSSEKTAEKTPAPYTAQITGIIRLVGNDPFARLLVTSDDEKNYIIADESPARKALHSMQGRRVSMEGIVREYPVYAGKKYLGVECIIFPEHYDFIKTDTQ